MPDVNWQGFHCADPPLLIPLCCCEQVSEHASWSSLYYGRIISAALAAVGAPPDLVQIVTGYGDAGHALVTSGVGKLVFVGTWAFSRCSASTCDWQRDWQRD